MTYESQAVDDLIRFSMGGISTASRIMGDFSHRVLKLIFYCLKDTSSSRGSKQVKSMVQSEKELKVLCIRDDDLEVFSKSASHAGITYCILKDSLSEGLSNILIYASDAGRAAKIMKRYNLEKVDVYSSYEAKKDNAVLNPLPQSVAKSSGDRSLNPTEERKTESSVSEATLDQYKEDDFRSLPVRSRMELLNRQAQNTLSRLRERPMNLPKSAPEKSPPAQDLSLPLSVAKPVEK